MCTVSLVIPTPAALRIVVNRDESRDRPDALPPAWRTIGPRRAIYPVDPVGGGTWVGAADHGLVLCLLNHHPTPSPVLPPPERLRSRGLIIPSLIAEPDSTHVAAHLRGLPLDRFAPFRLIAFDPRTDAASAGIEASWDRCELTVRALPRAPLCAVSSGLGDRLVEPRLDLFETLVLAHSATPAAQDRFHRHAWPDRPEISVLMNRESARTVSITTIEVGAASTGDGRRSVTMDYQVIPAHAGASTPPCGLSAYRQLDDH